MAHTDAVTMLLANLQVWMTAPLAPVVARAVVIVVGWQIGVALPVPI